MGKRKDNKGRVLKTGEGQRKNGSYYFRYTDIHGKRCIIYDSSLDVLRMKETEIQRNIADGIDTTGAEITAIELLKKYITIKQLLSESTREGYFYTAKTLEKEAFMQKKICKIKLSDAKAFVIKLSNDGKKYNTIMSYLEKIRPAFQMAVDDDLIKKNPFRFKLSDVIKNDTEDRRPLSEYDKNRLLEFAKDFPCYDEIVILLGTGLRVSELCGLTISDIDFTNRKISVNKQLLKNSYGEYRVASPKTKSGTRYIPMLNDEVVSAFKRVLQNRIAPRVETMIDGVTGFVFLNSRSKPKVSANVRYEINALVKRYNESHSVMLPEITPHIFRHTFCTELANKGMNLKSLQYVLGHNDACTTLNVYAACDYELAERELARVLEMG